MPDPTDNGTPSSTPKAYSDALNAALDEIDRLQGIVDDATSTLQGIPTDKDHTADRTRAQIRLTQAEGELARAQRTYQNVLTRQGGVDAQASTQANKPVKPNEVPVQRTPQGVWTKDDTQHPGPDGSPGWRRAVDGDGNPLPGTASDRSVQDAIAQQNANTRAQQVASGSQVAQQNANTASRNADTAASNAATRSAVGGSQVDVNEARTANIAALTPYQIQDLQARGVLTAAQAQSIADKTPAQIAQMVARGDLSSAQAAQINQRMQLALAPQDVSAPVNQPNIAQRDPSSGQISFVPNQNYTASDVAGRVSQLKQQAQTKRDQLNSQVQSGQKTADQAAQEFDTWWSTNIDPFSQQLQQQQAQQTQDAQIKANQDARAQQATEQSAFTTAQTAGRDAASRAESLLPYMVGPGYGAAVNNIAGAFASGKAPQNLDIGSAVTFNAPDFNGIAEQATAQALAHLSPTAAGKVGAPMPQVPQGIDIGAALNKSQYQIGATTTIAPDGTVTIHHQSPQPFAQSGLSEGSSRGTTASLPPPLAPNEMQMFGNYLPPG